MNALRHLVVATLLGVWCFPAVGMAKPVAGEVDSRSATVASTPVSAQRAPSGSEARSLAEREKQSRELEDFRGGGVSIYIGSGALLVVIIILLILVL